MRLTIGIVLTLVGGVVVVIGVLGALSELVSLYSSALNDAMAEGPEGKAVGASMMRWAILGAAGVPFLLVGSVLLKISLFQKIRKMHAKQVASMQQQAARSQPAATVKRAEAMTARPGPAARPASTNPPRETPPRQDNLGESGGNKSER